MSDLETRLFNRWLAETGTLIIACRECATGTDLAHLLIVDDVEYGEVLSGIWPSQLDNGSIAVTSRRTEIRDHGFTYPVEVHPFGAEEGSKLLLRIIQATNAGTEKDGLEASISISQQLGGLPLAIVHIAGYMNEMVMTTEFVNAYRAVWFLMQQYRINQYYYYYF